jgi:putative sigma-54 modulation protein
MAAIMQAKLTIIFNKFIMQVTIHEQGLRLNETQKDYINEKIDHLKKYEERVDDESTQVRVDVEMNKVKTSNKNIRVQVTMYVPNAVIRAEVDGVTMEEGIDLAVEKLRKQIERYKTKRNRRDKSGKWIPASTLEEISATQEVAPTPVSSISKRKSFQLGAMHEEEAIEQLELVDHNFYVFLNAETMHVNLVYRRLDGTYGLLDFSISNS